MPGLLNERIAALRKERGLTQEQLGQMVGVSAQAVSKWEKGGAPDVELLPVLAGQLGVTIDALFGLEGGEKVDVEDAVRRWIAAVPKGQRLDKLCRLVWSAVKGTLSYRGLELGDDPSLVYSDSCEQLIEAEDGRKISALVQTSFLFQEGIIHDVHAEDFWQEFKASVSSDYISALTNDLRLLSSTYISPLCLALFVTAGMVRSLLLMLYYQPFIALCALLFAVLIAMIPFLMGKLVGKYQGRRSKALSALNAQMSEAFSGFEVIRSFGIQGQINRRFQACCENLKRREYQYYAAASFADGMGQFFSLLAQTAILIMACYMVLRGKLSMGALVVFIGLSGSFCGNFSTILQFLPALKDSKPLIDRINALADDAADDSSTSAACIPPIQDAITVENLSFRYGEKPILQNLSLQFRKGGKYALTGPSGCGKSTLLKLLLGWLPDYGGAIRFDGRDAKGFTPEQLQQQISYIEQNVFLFNSTIRDNITLGGTFTEEQLQRALRDSALAGDLASLPDGLDTVAGEEGGNLSGGQKQRVAIAWALLHNRSILLVDEGTSALDQKNADIVEKSLLSNPELTLILVSHHLTPERKGQFTQAFDLQSAV